MKKSEGLDEAEIFCRSVVSWECAFLVRKTDYVTLPTYGKRYSYSAELPDGCAEILLFHFNGSAHAVGKHHRNLLIHNTRVNNFNGDKDAYVHHLCLIFPFRRKGNGR